MAAPHITESLSANATADTEAAATTHPASSATVASAQPALIPDAPSTRSEDACSLTADSAACAPLSDDASHTPLDAEAATPAAPGSALPTRSETPAPGSTEQPTELSAAQPTSVDLRLTKQPPTEQPPTEQQPTEQQPTEQPAEQQPTEAQTTGPLDTLEPAFSDAIAITLPGLTERHVSTSLVPLSEETNFALANAVLVNATLRRAMLESAPLDVSDECSNASSLDSGVTAPAAPSGGAHGGTRTTVAEHALKTSSSWPVLLPSVSPEAEVAIRAIAKRHSSALRCVSRTHSSSVGAQHSTQSTPANGILTDSDVSIALAGAGTGSVTPSSYGGRMAAGDSEDDHDEGESDMTWSEAINKLVHDVVRTGSPAPKSLAAQVASGQVRIRLQPRRLDPSAYGLDAGSRAQTASVFRTPADQVR